jgi:nucleoside-diphosphate-sugar epimerase
LPRYFAGFDVGIIPYRKQERMTYVNPLKLREYLAGGLPVVSTPLDEVEKYRGMCEIAEGGDAFVAAIERQLASTMTRTQRSDAMREETWAARARDVQRRIAEVKSGAQCDDHLSEHVPFLVTGGAGSLGHVIVDRLRRQGHRVRVFDRRRPEPQDNVECAIGNLDNPADVDRAVRGADVVIHAGAVMKGDWATHEAGTITGTRNVIDACFTHRVSQLVHISSLSVVDYASSTTIDETTPLEPRADERGFYTRAKLAAENLVSDAAVRGLPCVILRPGQIFGGGIPAITGAVARNAAGRWLILGDGNLELPLVYIEDVVDAIIAAVDKRLTGGQIIQLVDPTHLTQSQVLDAADGDRSRIAIPRGLVFTLGKLSELPLKLLGKTSPIAAYRLQSALAQVEYRSDKARELLGWSPRVGVRAGLAR